MTAPAWLWEVSAAVLIVVIIAEIVLTSLPGRGSFTTRSAIIWIAIYMSLAVIFGLSLGITGGWVMAGQFSAGYLTEYSLSLDNLFIFYVIMGWFAVPSARQPRVLLLGIGLALVLRSVLIVAGAAALNRFSWLFYPLGGILVWTAIGLITGRQDGQPEGHSRALSWLRRHLATAEDRDHRPIARKPGRPPLTPMLLLIAAIGLADVLFAVDSIPAIFGITTNASLVVACNVFALMGLRQLYALIARILDRIVYLNIGLGIICAFIGVKLLLHALHESGMEWAMEIPAWLSVVVVALVLTITVIAGIVKIRRTTPNAALPAGAAPSAVDEGGGSDGGNRRPQLTAGQWTALERRFAVIDIDGNGVWQCHDYHHLTQRVCEAFGHAVDSEAGQAVATGQRVLFDALLSHMDADGNQEISLDEFAGALGRTVKDRPGFDAAVLTAADALVRAADQDGNGVLDPGEYARLAAVYGARADEAARAFDRLDQDHNGVLDTAELAQAISQFFIGEDFGTCHLSADS